MLVHFRHIGRTQSSWETVLLYWRNGFIIESSSFFMFFLSSSWVGLVALERPWHYPKWSPNSSMTSLGFDVSVPHFLVTFSIGSWPQEVSRGRKKFFEKSSICFKWWSKLSSWSYLEFFRPKLWTAGDSIQRIVVTDWCLECDFELLRLPKRTD